MIIDGKRIAADIYARLAQDFQKRRLTLGILVGDSSPVIDSFVRIKAKVAEKLGVALVRSELSSGATTNDAIRSVRELAEKSDGIIVQLPLPSSLDVQAVLAAIPSRKDVDGISPAPKVRPPVAGAIQEILRIAQVEVSQARGVVVGSGRLVGAPAAALLRELGAEVIVLKKGDSLDALKNADIVVLGAGESGIVKPKHLKEGVVLIDAGTSESEGKVLGDADPACALVASVFTPVPGGVGPIAVAMIFKNLHDLSIS